MPTTDCRHAGLFRTPRVDEIIDAQPVARALGLNKAQLADVLGVSVDALRRRRRERSAAVQARLRELIEVMNHVHPWAGSAAQAFAWYRAQPLPSFGDLTAEELVKRGDADAVMAYLSRIGDGGYA